MKIIKTKACTKDKKIEFIIIPHFNQYLNIHRKLYSRKKNK